MTSDITKFTVIFVHHKQKFQFLFEHRHERESIVYEKLKRIYYALSVLKLVLDDEGLMQIVTKIV